MKSWVKLARGAGEELDHVTRMFPSRAADILGGGSLYWVIRGAILCRQPIADLQPIVGEDGIKRCRILFKPQIILVRPAPRRPFQGWRYLTAEDAPADLKRSDGAAEMDEPMRRELAALGLI